MKLRAGEWVEVRSKEEILATLDKNGRLNELPFMPEMLAYCGQRYRVQSRAYKTCDTVSGDYAGRSLPDAVHLSLRCDGQAHGGCQAGCLIFWKTEWLKAIQGPVPEAGPTDDRHNGCSESEVWRAAQDHGAAGEIRFSCQATQLLSYTSPLKWWDARQYLEAYTSGNRNIAEIVRGLFYLFYYYATLAFRERWGGPSRWLYNRIQSLTHGVPFPRMKGTIPAGVPTPREDLALAPGDVVRVKPYEKILATLDTRLSNRGLWFDAELVPFCGRQFRVSRRVERFVDEKTGKLRTMKTPAVMLANVTCQALYSGRRMFCPRGINLWWREIWLERVTDGAAGAPAEDVQWSVSESCKDQPVTLATDQAAGSLVRQ
jgi:hypothetical protein